LLFAYVPGLSERYKALTPIQQALVMLSVLFATAAGLFALACAGLASTVGVALACDQAGLVVLLQAFGKLLIANQMTYLTIVRPAARSQPTQLGPRG
ncbi:MAG: hypothetical protein ACKOC5_07610, partial [Chloroflexota bacterium]